MLARGLRCCRRRAWAGAPPVRAAAYLVEDARTGEILASSNAHADRPIASLTKLMTVLLTLQHHKLTDVVTVDPRAAAVGESSIELDSGEQMTVERSAEGHADPVGERRGRRARALDGARLPVVRPADERRGGEARAARHAFRPARTGSTRPDEYSSAADITRLARLVMHTRFVRETVRQETATISGGRTLHTWDDLLSQFPQTIGVKTGHTDLGGLVPGRRRARPRRDDLRDAARLSDPLGAERRPAVAPDLGARAVPPRPRGGLGRMSTPMSVLPYGRAPVALVAAKPLLTVARLGRPLTETVVAPVAVSLPVRQGTGARTRRDPPGERSWSERAIWSLPAALTNPASASRLGWYAGRTLHHLAHLF